MTTQYQDHDYALSGSTQCKSTEEINLRPIKWFCNPLHIPRPQASQPEVNHYGAPNSVFGAGKSPLINQEVVS